MNRLTTVFLLVLPIVIVACASSVVPTVAPTVPPTLEQVPTVTIEPTQQPTPTPPEIPVPYTIITPTRVVTLTVTDITGTISTRGKAAIVWLADGVRHFGILDVDRATVSQLPFSLEDNYKQSGDVVWSPIGNALVYEQHVVDNFGVHMDYDIFGIPVDGSKDGKLLSKSLQWFNGCNWSPDGHYLICSFRPTHRGTSLPDCIRVFDPSTWKMICGADEQLYCIDDNHVCRPLPLGDGTLWIPSALRLDEKPTLEATEEIHGGITYILLGAKILNVTWSPLK